jgi:hypothetical protein
MTLFVSSEQGQLGQSMDIGDTGTYILSNLVNDQAYYLTLAGVDGAAQCDYSRPIAVTPKADPLPPSGSILINNGAPATRSKDVVINISATDEPLLGMASPAGTTWSGPLAGTFNSASGVTEMRISNDASLADAAWEPLVAEKPWTLGDSQSDVYQVFAQFRDAAGNESFVVFDDILLLEPTAVTLISFTGQGGSDHVTLAWETASELDNEGFNIWRSEATDGEYGKINASLIPAQGNADTGASYEYVDGDVVKGVTYYYKLEDVDIHGVSTFHGPVSATPGPFQPLYLPLILK